MRQLEEPQFRSPRHDTGNENLQGCRDATKIDKARFVDQIHARELPTSLAEAVLGINADAISFSEFVESGDSDRNRLLNKLCEAGQHRRTLRIW